MTNQVRKYLLLTVLLLVGATSGAAQQSVTGRVTNAETLGPVAGALVAVQGTNAAVLTGADGRYTINAPGNGVLVFSMLGFSQQSVPISGRSTVDVSLAVTAMALDEVIAVGYTNQTQRSITGAVASVQAEALEERQVVTVEDALKGRVAGVTVRTSGEPGEPAVITIRGSAFTSDNSPLYVVDGMYLRQDPGLNPNDIESIQILKDASAASQYGAQAANGVIIITTKKGRAADGNRIELQSYYGRSETPRILPMRNAREWADFTKVMYDNAIAQQPGFTEVPPGVLYVLNGTNTTDTDWQREILGPGYLHDHTLSMSGGTSSGDANYFVSGGYTNRFGEMIESSFERFTFRVNSELRRGRLTLGENLSLSRANATDAENILQNSLQMIPAIPVMHEDGTWGFGNPDYPTFATNPVGQATLVDDFNRDDQLIGRVFGIVDLTSDLKYQLNIGVRGNQGLGDQFERVGTLRQNTDRGPATLTINNNISNSILLENLLSFNRVFGLHNINAVAGATQQRNTSNNTSASRRNFTDERLRVLAAGTENIINSQSRNETRLSSFLGRVSYALADRYMVEGSFRRDGSSRFGPANRWGNFYAGSVGWVVSEEGFFQGIPGLRGAEFLKLRASYGTLGNQDFADYEWQANVDSNRNYILGPGSSLAIQPGLIVRSLSNPNIKWQENTMENYGIDLGLLDNTLAITAEYYVSTSGDLLVRIPLVPSLGSNQSPFVNAGSIENRGFEFSLQHTYNRGALELASGFNFNTISNEVISLGDGGQPIFSGVSRTAVGLPMGHFWTYDMLGIFQTQEEVTAHAVQPNARPGDVKYRDINGDGIVNTEDRFNSGNPWPDLAGGAFIDGSFRQVDFNIGLTGSFGGKIYNSYRENVEAMTGDANTPTWLTPWTPENRSTTTPRALFSLGGDNARASQRYIEDGSYLKLQNIQVGYTLPESVASRAGLQSRGARLYVNLQNIHTFTDYLGYDPEFRGSTLSPGVDGGTIYPNPRMFTVGVNLGL